MDSFRPGDLDNKQPPDEAGANDTQRGVLLRLRDWASTLFAATPEQPAEERRRHPRIPAQALQSCLLIGDRYCDGRLEDISLGGAKFRGPGSKAPGVGAEVRVVSPTPLPREVRGRVLACSPGLNDFTLHIEWLPATSREALGVLISFAEAGLTTVSAA